MVDELDDERRTEPAFLLDERAMLEGWLEYHRTTLALKCEGLDDEQRKRRPVATSKLSLHGLVRHMAEVERNWFGRVLGRPRRAAHLVRPGRRRQRAGAPRRTVWADDLAAWLAECDASRRMAAGAALDDTGIRRGQPCSLRWIYTHMIEESRATTGTPTSSASWSTARSAAETDPRAERLGRDVVALLVGLGPLAERCRRRARCRRTGSGCRRRPRRRGSRRGTAASSARCRRRGRGRAPRRSRGRSAIGSATNSANCTSTTWSAGTRPDRAASMPRSSPRKMSSA